jgi:hypothetical protein
MAQTVSAAAAARVLGISLEDLDATQFDVLDTRLLASSGAKA